MRVVPVEIAFGQRFTFEKWQQTHSVDVLLRLQRYVGQLKNGRIKVRACDRNVTHGLLPGYTRRLDVIRIADAALPLTTFPTTKGQVGRRVGITGRNAAIVAREQDRGIVRKSEFIQFAHHHANGPVHRFHHPRIDGIVLNLANRHRPVEQESRFGKSSLFGLCDVLRAQCGGRLNRRMHSIEGEVGEKRLIFVRFNKADSF